MNTEKQIKMSLDLAKQMLGKDEVMDMFIKQNFNDEELGIEKKLPKKWEDIEILNGYIITNNSYIAKIDEKSPSVYDRNTLPTKELAQAMLALCQLLYLRNIYNDGWEPDWCDLRTSKYCICNIQNDLKIIATCITQCNISFKSKELVNEFMINFKDLLEIAKPFL